MALAAPKVDAPAPKKVEKTAKERPAKADGPVARIKAFIDANAAALRKGEMTRVTLIDTLKSQGIVPGTIGVQVPKHLRELGIVPVPGSRKKVKPNGDTAPVAAKGKKVTAPVEVKSKKKTKEVAPAPKGKTKTTATPVAKGKTKGKVKAAK